VTVEGNKIGKSLGNAIHPKLVVGKYGVDAFRYYLLREIPAYGDGDFSFSRMEEIYKADLQNGLGNLAARVAAMAVGIEQVNKNIEDRISEKVETALQEFKFDEALKDIWERIKSADQYVSEKKVWTLVGDEKKLAIEKLVKEIRQIAVDLVPFMPSTAEKIITQYKSAKIEKTPPLFPRIETV
jgi:methionyl-tRNA synthetase